MKKHSYKTCHADPTLKGIRAVTAALVFCVAPFRVGSAWMILLPTACM